MRNGKHGSSLTGVCGANSPAKRALRLAAFAVLFITAIFSFVGCKDGGGDDGGSDPGGENDRTYALGDTGPGGGRIFYVSETGFIMTDNNTRCHYLEAAPADISETKAWASSSSYQSTSINGTDVIIGAGRRNTALILGTDADAPAAFACKNYSNNGKSDWFLPSKNELAQLYINREVVTALSTNTYWSSSENSNSSAWYQSFSSGSQDNSGSYGKRDTYMVRAVRAF